MEIWRRNIECHDLTFGMQRVMLRVTRRRKRAFVWKSKQNQCDKELLNAYQLVMTRRWIVTTLINTKQVFVFILKHKFYKFMPLLTSNLSCENVKYPARKHFEKTNKAQCHNFWQ